MITEIPYLYEATVVRRGKRNPEKVRVRSSLPVRIREEEGLPLAAVYAVGTGKRRYFWTGSGLVTPWATTARAEAGFRGGKNPFQPELWDTYAAEIEEGERVQHWVTDNKLEVSGQVAAGAAAAVVTHGCLCTRTEGPGWRVVWEEDEPTAVAAVADVAYDTSRASRVYRADRLRDAIAHAATLPAPEGVDPAVAPEVRGAVEVLIPEAQTFDDDWWALKAAIREVVDDNPRQVGSWPRAAALAWLDLRDGLAAGGGFSTETLDAARTLLANRGRMEVFLSRSLLDEAVARIDRGRCPEPVAAPALRL